MEYTYYAFISYKREDEKWAKWLQNKLEAYGFPTALRKEKPSLPSKIRPVFRDESELSGGNLKDEIEKGLEGSKYLIVICSPRAAKSPWVSKEVQYFIDHGRENNIIPFIIGGNPNATNPEDACFPEGLRQLSGEKEILGININEMGRDAAAIKVIARMFDLRFDTLWQRHERAKRRRRIAFIVGALVFALLSLGVATIMIELKQKADSNAQIAKEESIRANNERNRANTQTDIAEKERDNALEANRALARAKDSIQLQSNLLAQTNKDLEESNRHLAEERNNVLKASIQILSEKRRLVARDANQMLHEGRTLEAWDLLLENSPSESDIHNPVSPEIVSILYKIYYLLNNDDLNCIANLESDLKDNNEHMVIGDYGPFISPDGKYNAYCKDGFFILYDFLSNEKFVLEGTDLTECSEFRYSQDGNYLYSFGWEYLFGWEVDSKRLFIRKLKADFTDNYAMDEGDWRTIEKLYGKKLSSRTYKDFEYTDSSFFNELKKTDYGYGLKMPKLRDKDISDFQVNDNIYIIQNYVFSNRRIAELEPTLDKYCHIFPSPNEISIFNQSIPVKSSHEDQFIDFENNKWKLISSNYGMALYYKEGTEIDENDNQILNYSCDSILMIKNRKKYIIPTIPLTTTGNGSNYISDVHIFNSESLLFEAGQGPHTLYDINTNSRTIFQQSFLNEESGGYAHILRFPIYSDIIINNQVFFTISVGGVLSLWDINSGVLLWEFALPYTTAAYSSPYVFNVRRTGAMTLYITLASHETNEQIMNYSFKIPYLTTFINYMRKQRLKFTHRK